MRFLKINKRDFSCRFLTEKDTERCSNPTKINLLVYYKLGKSYLTLLILCLLYVKYFKNTLVKI